MSSFPSVERNTHSLNTTDLIEKPNKSIVPEYLQKSLRDKLPAIKNLMDEWKKQQEDKTNLQKK